MSQFRPTPLATPSASALAERERRRLFLQPGQVVAAAEPAAVTTILGSCVAVCLWDPTRGLGGVNHFLLPYRVDGNHDRWRYAAGAIHGLMAELERLGAKANALQAKVFGGACVLAAFRGGDQADHLGRRNVEVARAHLRELGVPVVAEAVGGDHGRKLIFQTDDGTAWVKALGGGGG